MMGFMRIHKARRVESEQRRRKKERNEERKENRKRKGKKKRDEGDNTELCLNQQGMCRTMAGIAAVAAMVSSLDAKIWSMVSIAASVCTVCAV
jgi:hypothetical protein